MLVLSTRCLPHWCSLCTVNGASEECMWQGDWRSLWRPTLQHQMVCLSLICSFFFLYTRCKILLTCCTFSIFGVWRKRLSCTAINSLFITQKLFSVQEIRLNGSFRCFNQYCEMDITHADFLDRILDLHNRMGTHLLRFILLAWKQKTFLVCVSAQHQNSATLSPGLYYLAVQ